MPAWVLSALSPVAKLAQRILLPRSTPIDLAAAFASERYDATLAAQMIRRSQSAARGRDEHTSPLRERLADAPSIGDGCRRTARRRRSASTRRRSTRLPAGCGAPANATILDAGCGSCAKSVLLAARGFRVVGVDFSANALQLAAQTIKERGLVGRVSLNRGDLLGLPFKTVSFEYILCWGVLMHVSEVQRAVAELSRLLAPGGKLVLSEGNMYSVESLALRTLKRILGRGRGRLVRVPVGLESHETTECGGLVTRQTDVASFVAMCDRLGLRLQTRIAGQFTELYALMPWRWLRRAIHGWNNAWFQYVQRPGPAYGNILIFEKQA